VDKYLGDESVNIQKWVSLFLKTLVLGIVIYFIVGCLAQWRDLSHYLSTGDPKGIAFTLINFIIFGGLFSVLSQMGFFCILNATQNRPRCFSHLLADDTMGFDFVDLF